MPSRKDIEVIAERLHRAAPEATIILFGSHARGRADDHSDVDLLVVEPSVDCRHTEIVRLRDQIRGLGVPTDVLVVSQADFDEWRDEPGTVLYDAAREGTVLYGAAETR